MTESHILIIGGLTTEQHDVLRAISGKRLTPNGHVVVRPAGNSGLSMRHADDLIEQATKIAMSLDERTPISIMAIVVGKETDQARAFSRRFFPFALSRRVDPPIAAANSRSQKLALDLFVSNIVELAADLRKRSSAISHHMNVGNIVPLLLPTRNFRNDLLVPMLEKLFEGLPIKTDVDSLIREHLVEFDRQCPRVKPEGGEKKRCYSDGHLYFHGPGRNRHGFFRYSKTTRHTPSCLLSARSRLGGHYDYSFHFDCAPVSGLNPAYPNCHGEQTPPKQTHVNIAPNDYVI